MRGRSPRLAWALATLSLVLVVLDTVIVSVSIGMFSTRSLGIHGWPLVDVAASSSAVLGAVIVSTDHRQPIGWLLNAIGVLTSLSMMTESYARWILFEGGDGSTRVAELAGWISAATGGAFALAGLTVAFLLLPDGRLLSPAWRWVAIGSVLGFVLYCTAVARVGPHAISAQDTHPAAGDAVSEVLFAVAILTILTTMLASVVCLAIRFVRSEGLVRRQVRIVAFGAASVGLALATLVISQAMSGGDQQVWSSLLLYLAYDLLLVCMGVAVLRYRLYDVELIISRGLVVAVAAVFAAVGYVGLVVALGRAAGHRTGGFYASLAAMTLVALAFQPLRAGVVRLADRLAYGSRAAPYEALAAFSRLIGRSPAPGAVLPAIAAAAGQAVAATCVAVRFDVAAGDDLVEVWPPGDTSPIGHPTWTVPIADEHGTLGSIELFLPPGRHVRPVEQRMLGDIADQAGVAFRNVRLQVELAAQVRRLDERRQDLDASRRRVIEAADMERRRLEAALAREVLPAMTALRADLADTAACVDEGMVEAYIERANAALESLRELTRGIYPTLLTRSGVTAALRSFADRRGVGGVLSIDPDLSATRYAERVEAAVYFCCVEVLVREPGPRAVDVTRTDDHLIVTIAGSTVDGPDRLGMSDRVEAAGGRLTESDGRITIELPALGAPSLRPATPSAGVPG